MMKKAKQPHLKKNSIKGADLNSDQSPDQSRTRLLQVAQALFAKKGFDGVSVREIAKASNLNLSLVSYYFGGKEGLYRAVISQYFEQGLLVFEQLKPLFEKAGTDKASYINFWRSFLKQVIIGKIENVQIEEILLIEFLKGLPYSYEIHKKVFPVLVKNLDDLIQTGQNKKWIRNDLDSYLFLANLFSGIDTVIVTSRTRSPFKAKATKYTKNIDLWVDQLIKIYFEGVRL